MPCRHQGLRRGTLLGKGTQNIPLEVNRSDWESVKEGIVIFENSLFKEQELSVPGGIEILQKRDSGVDYASTVDSSARKICSICSTGK